MYQLCCGQLSAPFTHRMSRMHVERVIQTVSIIRNIIPTVLDRYFAAYPDLACFFSSKSESILRAQVICLKEIEYDSHQVLGSWSVLCVMWYQWFGLHNRAIFRLLLFWRSRVLWEFPMYLHNASFRRSQASTAPSPHFNSSPYRSAHQRAAPNFFWKLFDKVVALAFSISAWTISDHLLSILSPPFSSFPTSWMGSNSGLQCLCQWRWSFIVWLQCVRGWRCRRR